MEPSIPTDGSIVLGFHRVSHLDGSDAHLSYVVLVGASLLMASSEDDCEIVTSEAHTCVERRYSQFEQLRASLKPRAQRAGLILPPFPSKLDGFGRKLSQAVGTRRKKGLQSWLRAVVDEPLLHCEALRLFLGLMQPHPLVEKVGQLQTVEHGSS